MAQGKENCVTNELERIFSEMESRDENYDIDLSKIVELLGFKVSKQEDTGNFLVFLLDRIQVCNNAELHIDML